MICQGVSAMADSGWTARNATRELVLIGRAARNASKELVSNGLVKSQAQKKRRPEGRPFCYLV